MEAGVYFWHPNEVVCLSSGEDDRFMDYYPSSLIHFEAMLDCIARGVERFNFYGISGIFDANDPSYGVWTGRRPRSDARSRRRLPPE